jgi:hypothetical protein
MLAATSFAKSKHLANLFSGTAFIYLISRNFDGCQSQDGLPKTPLECLTTASVECAWVTNTQKRSHLTTSNQLRLY